MKLNSIIIDTVEKWEKYAPPMGKDKQWRDGRSAKELAKYVMVNCNKVPEEIEKAIPPVSPKAEEFDWVAEYITPFPYNEFGQGEGRHHDMILFNPQIFIGIEAKADEPFDKILSEWLVAGNGIGSEVNRRKRANAMCRLIFGDDSSNHLNIRYQLMSALTGVLIEAEKRKNDTAMLLIVTFKRDGYFRQEYINRNEKDLADFLKAVSWNETTGRIKTYSGIDNVFVKHITISVV